MELNIIENGLKCKGSFFEATYLWKKDPRELQDNRSAAYAILLSQEKQLKKNKTVAKLYTDEMKDMIHRGVGRKLSHEELQRYDGPIQYLTHHEIIRLDHSTTKCRILFTASENVHVYNPNDYWMEGPDLLNNMCITSMTIGWKVLTS